MTRKGRLASVIFTSWLMGVIALMLLRQIFSLEVFFVLAVIGLLVVVVLIDTSSVQPRYLQRMNYVVVIALLIFGYIVANRLVELLPQ